MPKKKQKTVDTRHVKALMPDPVSVTQCEECESQCMVRNVKGKCLDFSKKRDSKQREGWK
jgi:hypothetical protein